MSGPKASVAARALGLGLFGLSVLAAVALVFAYWRAAGTQVLGGLLALSLLAAAGGLVVWSRAMIPDEIVPGPREPLASPGPEMDGLVTEIEQRGRSIGRRMFLAGALIAFAGALSAAFISLLRSFMGPDPLKVLSRTPWAAGVKLVRRDGSSVEAAKVPEGSVITVFPEGHAGELAGETVLVRLKPDVLKLPADRMAWTVDGLIAYSRICTHAGCPVSQYYDTEHILACPCHQSTFDLAAGGRPTGGPATQPLPQLPLGVDDAGLLVAKGGFLTPPGPGYWRWTP
jgi:ubiquinol-cytochrome c reductase iron-sulfur subunit